MTGSKSFAAAVAVALLALLAAACGSADYHRPLWPPAELIVHDERAWGLGRSCDPAVVGGCGDGLGCAGPLEGVFWCSARPSWDVAQDPSVYCSTRVNVCWKKCNSDSDCGAGSRCPAAGLWCLPSCLDQPEVCRDHGACLPDGHCSGAY